MKLTIEGTEYEVDVEKAKKHGYLKEVVKPVKNFQIGDVFEGENSFPILIVQPEYFTSAKMYSLLALRKDMMLLSSYYNLHGLHTRQEVLNNINNNKLTFRGNILEKLKDILPLSSWY